LSDLVNTRKIMIWSRNLVIFDIALDLVQGVSFLPVGDTTYPDHKALNNLVIKMQKIRKRFEVVRK